MRALPSKLATAAVLFHLLSTPALHAHPEGHGPADDEQANELRPVASVPYQPEVEITESNGYRIIRSNDIPNHAVGHFPNRNNPNQITPQQLEYRVPLEPELTGKWQSAERVMGVAVNGVPIEPGTAETWHGNFQWREEAIVDGQGRLGLDQNNAHVQPTGKYHYHGIPWGLIRILQQEQQDAEQPLLIGWAADGFPIYYQADIQSSWQLRQGNRPDPPQGPGGRYDGTYTADYEFVEGSGDLDRANGKTGPTPEYPEGTYHYYVTEEFPFFPRYFAGTPDSSFGMPRHHGPPHGGQHRGPRGHRGPPPPY